MIKIGGIIFGMTDPKKTVRVNTNKLHIAHLHTCVQCPASFLFTSFLLIAYCIVVQHALVRVVLDMKTKIWTMVN